MPKRIKKDEKYATLVVRIPLHAIKDVDEDEIEHYLEDAVQQPQIINYIVNRVSFDPLYPKKEGATATVYVE